MSTPARRERASEYVNRNRGVRDGSSGGHFHFYIFRRWLSFLRRLLRKEDEKGEVEDVMV